jgi:hypothetical protein
MKLKSGELRLHSPVDDNFFTSDLQIDSSCGSGQFRRILFPESDRTSK